MSEENIDGKQAEQVSEETVNAAESSSVEEKEDTKALLQKKDEEIERLKSHLQNKEKKNKTEEFSDEERKLLQEVKARLDRQEASAKEVAFNQALQTDWGSQYSTENDPEGKKVAELNDALSLVNAKYPVLSSDDYAKNLRRAHRMISDEESVDPSLQTTQKLKEEVGATGSTVRRSDVDQDAKLSARELSFRSSFRRANNIKE
jgi:DNA repair exonuclease SbcCD ATPase subunit